jgi:Mg-chelatase subunit ChlI
MLAEANKAVIYVGELNVVARSDSAYPIFL